jgi:hypothetical protein
MPNTSKMIWPFPAKDSDPWYEGFASMVAAMDASGYASREDRNILLSEGGSVSFTASSGLLSWAGAIVLLSPIAPFKLTIPAGSVTLLDGQRLYVNVTRSPATNVSLAAMVADGIPNTNDAMLIAVRSGSDVYFRNGSRISDGESKTLFESAGASPGAEQVDVVKLATRESHNSVTPLIAGGDSFDPTDYDKPGFARTLVFRAVAANGDVGMTNTVTLYNVTDSEAVAVLTFTSTAPTKDEVVLVEGSGAGEIDLVEKIYEVRIALTAPPGGPTETIELLGAELVIVSTAV